MAPLVVGPSTLPLPPVSSYGPPHRYMAFHLFGWPITSSIGSPRHRWACYVAASSGHCVVDSPVVACSVVDWPTVSSMGHGVLTMDPSCRRSGAVLFIGPWSCRLSCHRVDSPTSSLGRCLVDWARHVVDLSSIGRRPVHWAVVLSVRIVAGVLTAVRGVSCR